MFSKKIFLFIFIFFIPFIIFAQPLELKYKCDEINTSTNQIKPLLQIKNTTFNDYQLHDIKIRYYYTLEYSTPSPTDQVFHVDYCSYQEDKITITNNHIQDTEYYVEISYETNAGLLTAGMEIDKLYLRFHKVDWSNYDQANDYSFDSTKTDYELYDKICIYLGTELVWGTTPDGETPGGGGSSDPVVDNSDDWLRVSGNRLYDMNGNMVRITGINYFGFETEKKVFHGLSNVDLRECLELMADLGFNLIRIPLSVQLVDKWRRGEVVYPASDAIDFYEKNEYLVDKDSLEVFDIALYYCQELGLKVMLDMHEVLEDRKRNCWYYGDYTTADYIACWQWLANRYKNNDTIIAMDLFNEPHGKIYTDDYAAEGDPAIWNDDELNETEHNWKRAFEITASVILKENPNVLVMIDGIHSFPKDPINNDYILCGYEDSDEYYENWWGGNLRGNYYYPIDLDDYQLVNMKITNMDFSTVDTKTFDINDPDNYTIDPNITPITDTEYNEQLVFEPHDYGPTVWPDHPWFQGEISDQRYREECWYPNWFYIHMDAAQRETTLIGDEQNPGVLMPEEEIEVTVNGVTSIVKIRVYDALLANVLRNQPGYSLNPYALLIGEWGSKMDDADDIFWFQCFADFIVENDLNFTYWCFNPNSGDTGGIVKADWKTVELEKYNIVKPTLWRDANDKGIGLDHNVKLGNDGTNVAEFYE